MSQKQKEPILEFTGKYFFLSNFYRAPIVFEGRIYPTVENAYQAAKAINGSVEFEQIADANGPGKAKKLGRRVKLDEKWHETKLHLMAALQKCKYEQHEDLRLKLIATAPAQLEEGNGWGDRFWGVCPMGSKKGQNNLGKILMNLRDELHEK